MKDDMHIKWQTQEEDCKLGNHVSICKCSCGEIVDIEGVMRAYGQKEAKQACQEMIDYLEGKFKSKTLKFKDIEATVENPVICAAKEYLSKL